MTHMHEILSTPLKLITRLSLYILRQQTYCKQKLLVLEI